MMKRLLLAAILSLPTMSVANLAAASDPPPSCYPCQPKPPSATRAAVVIPADAR